MTFTTINADDMFYFTITDSIMDEFIYISRFRTIVVCYY